MQETFNREVEKLTKEEEALIRSKIEDAKVSPSCKSDMLTLLETHKKGGLSAEESKKILSDLYTISFD